MWICLSFHYEQNSIHIKKVTDKKSQEITSQEKKSHSKKSHNVNLTIWQSYKNCTRKEIHRKKVTMVQPLLYIVEVTTSYMFFSLGN